MQDRRKARGPDRGLFEVLELESPGETNQKNFEKTDLEKGFRLDQEGTGDDFGAECATGFTTLGQKTLGMNSPMLMPSVQDREVVERQQKVFKQGWIPCSLDTLRLSIFTRARS